MMRAMKMGLSKEEAKLQTPRRSGMIEFFRYFYCIAPFALVTQLFTVLAASITTSGLPPGTLRVAIMGSAVLVPTPILLSITNMIYDKFK
jgi:hypothetical protein